MITHLAVLCCHCKLPDDNWQAGYSALMAACRGGNLKLVQWLIDVHGQDPTLTFSHVWRRAATAGAVSTVLKTSVMWRAGAHLLYGCGLLLRES